VALLQTCDSISNNAHLHISHDRHTRTLTWRHIQ
jgi:hypothetical protein